MDVIPSVSSASWQFLCEWWLSASAVISCIRIVFLCDRWLQWGSVVLILHTRIVWYRRYLPCSLYQTCLVCDIIWSQHLPPCFLCTMCPFRVHHCMRQLLLASRHKILSSLSLRPDVFTLWKSQHALLITSHPIWHEALQLATIWYWYWRPVLYM